MKKQINYKKEFIEFLRERDLITSFCAGLAHPKWNDTNVEYHTHCGTSLSEYLNQNKSNIHQWVFTAFLWAKHPINKLNPHTYWNNIDNEWRRYLSHLND